MKRICFATNNQHKLAEVKQLLQSKIQIVSLQEIGCLEELPETQNTLEGNSLQKADFVFKKFGIACFADDTGLEVDILNGAPGVDSAHYGGPQRNGEANIARLLNELNGEKNRAAQFRTIITLIEPEGPQTFQGIVRGNILTSGRGSSGFGYDPVFQPEHYDLTFAEMSMEEKSKLSHRGLAIRKLTTFLLSKD